MDKLQLPHAKLFYFSAELYKHQTITENEKLKMKEMVINDEPQIFELLERYQASGNEQEFINSLLSLLRPHQRSQYAPQLIQVQQQAQPTRSTFLHPQKAVDNNYQNTPQRQAPQQIQESPLPQEPQRQDSAQQLQQDPTQAETISQFIEKHPDCPDEISSPLGLKLLKRKQKAQKNTTQIKEYLRPYKLDQD